MSNGERKPKSRIHPERLTQFYQWSHWYMKGWDERSVRARASVWLCQSECESWWSERKRFMWTNVPDMECEVSLRRLCLPGSRPMQVVQIFHDLHTSDACVPAVKTCFDVMTFILNKFHYIISSRETLGSGHQRKVQLLAAVTMANGEEPLINTSA